MKDCAEVLLSHGANRGGLHSGAGQVEAQYVRRRLMRRTMNLQSRGV